MSVPAFGEWEQCYKDGVVPTYSVDFSKIREIRRRNKSRVSIGNEEDLLHKSGSGEEEVNSASGGGSSEPVPDDRPMIPPHRSPTRMRKIMSYFMCGRREPKMVHNAPTRRSSV
ncbi:uncharacterized protein M6B38_117280 [Iris pallida]|uniref:Uncharacterized protein n=1 Tax=Iris pallida TaxID=29817 RepID=A0AAX6HTV6_IRIPA|nr:uncharacterized protein M6B38_117280 [Iris pallida]